MTHKNDASMIVLGVDPGIANTGFAVVESVHFEYRLLTVDHVKTSPKDGIGERLSSIPAAGKGITMISLGLLWNVSITIRMSQVVSRPGKSLACVNSSHLMPAYLVNSLHHNR